MIRCDYGIIAYGVSFYEFLYMGIPTINFIINEDDSNILDNIQDIELCIKKSNEKIDLGKLNNIQIDEKIIVGDLGMLHREIIAK